jgi:hypothetical protein
MGERHVGYENGEKLPVPRAAAPQPTPLTFLLVLISVLRFPAHCTCPWINIAKTSSTTHATINRYWSFKRVTDNPNVRQLDKSSNSCLEPPKGNASLSPSQNNTITWAIKLASVLPCHSDLISIAKFTSCTGFKMTESFPSCDPDSLCWKMRST